MELESCIKMIISYYADIMTGTLGVGHAYTVPDLFPVERITSRSPARLAQVGVAPRG